MGRAAPAPSELPVAEGAPQETWEEQWKKTAEMQRQDEEARAEFNHQRNLVEAHRRGEAAVAALEEQAQARRQELVDNKVSFVFAGVSEGLESTQPVPTGKAKGAASPMRKEGAAADLFDVTPRGTVGIKLNKARADRMRSPEVQVRVRLGEAVSAEASGESTRSRRSGGSRRPRSAVESSGGSRSRVLSSRPMSTVSGAPLDGPEPAVYMGTPPPLEPGTGVAIRQGEGAPRRGPMRPTDPLHLTRREYLSITTREQMEEEEPVAPSPPTPPASTSSEVSTTARKNVFRQAAFSHRWRCVFSWKGLWRRTRRERHGRRGWRTRRLWSRRRRLRWWRHGQRTGCTAGAGGATSCSRHRSGSRRPALVLPAGVTTPGTAWQSPRRSRRRTRGTSSSLRRGYSPAPRRHSGEPHERCLGIWVAFFSRWRWYRCGQGVAAAAVDGGRGGAA